MVQTWFQEKTKAFKNLLRCRFESAIPLLLPHSANQNKAQGYTRVRNSFHLLMERATESQGKGYRYREGW